MPNYQPMNPWVASFFGPVTRKPGSTGPKCCPDSSQVGGPNAAGWCIDTDEGYQLFRATRATCEFERKLRHAIDSTPIRYEPVDIGGGLIQDRANPEDLALRRAAEAKVYAEYPRNGEVPPDEKIELDENGLNRVFESWDLPPGEFEDKLDDLITPWEEQTRPWFPKKPVVEEVTPPPVGRPVGGSVIRPVSLPKFPGWSPPKAEVPMVDAGLDTGEQIPSWWLQTSR